MRELRNARDVGPVSVRIIHRAYQNSARTIGQGVDCVCLDEFHATVCQRRREVILIRKFVAQRDNTITGVPIHAAKEQR
jgi:hypothetical protein